MLQICLGYGALCWPLGFTTQELRDLHWIRTQPGSLFRVLWEKGQTWNTKLALNLQGQNFDLSGAQHCCDLKKKKGKDRQGARLGPPASQEYQSHRALVKGESSLGCPLLCSGTLGPVYAPGLLPFPPQSRGEFNLWAQVLFPQMPSPLDSQCFCCTCVPGTLL